MNRELSVNREFMIPRTCVLLPWLVSLAPAYTGALDIIFLLDISPDMIEPERRIAAGARLATYELSSDDRVALITFSSRAKTILPFTSDPRQVN